MDKSKSVESPVTDDSSIEFTVPMTAIAKERPRVFRVGKLIRTITPKKTYNYETIFGKYAQRAMGNRKPFDKPVAVTISFWFKPPKKPVYSHPTKSDLDNLLKAALDAMNKICWIDDRLIYRIVAGKYFSLQGEDSIAVRIETAESLR